MKNRTLIIIAGVCVMFVLLKKLTPQIVHTLWSNLAIKYASMYGVNAKWILSIITVESGGVPYVIGLTGDFGLMQITQPALNDFNTHFQTSFTLSDMMFNNEKNIQVGTWYLSWLLQQFNDDYQLAVSAYNQGIGNVQKNTFSLSYYEKVNNVFQTLT